MEGGFTSKSVVFIFITFSMFLQCLSTSFSAEIQILLGGNNNIKQEETCNPYEGKWVYDESYPLFDSSKCPSIRKEFDCFKYGRPDREYLKYLWQPNTCNLPRFDGIDFLGRMKGKMIMFVGDSVSQNQWNSLFCLLHEAAEGSNITRLTNKSITSITFEDYEVSVMVFLSHYLVDIENEQIGRVLNLDSLKDGEIWKEADVLIFNTWLWWGRSGPKQPWDYIEDNGTIVKDMDRMVAFRKALTTWTKWVNTYVDHSKTKVFFQGISPMHYNGQDWNEPGLTSCANETTPLSGSTYPSGEPLASKVLKEVLISSQVEVHLLDITTLSQLRKDGHPGQYNGIHGMDCTHWCVAGVLDTWNQLLYVQLLR